MPFNFKKLLRKNRLINRHYQLHKRSQVVHGKPGHPDWASILEPDRARWGVLLKEGADGPNILIPTSFGAQVLCTTVESLLAAALVARKARVHVLLCDAVLSACQECEINLYPRMAEFDREGPQKRLCPDCFEPARAMYASLGVTVHRYSDHLRPADHAEAARIAASVPLDEIPAYRFDGVAVGEHALAGALRFFAKATLDSEPYAGQVLRRYLRAAMLTLYATQRLLDGTRMACAVFNHGIYIPQGIIGEVARKNGVRVVNWVPAYRNKTFIFSHGDTYHHTLMDEPVGEWENLAWPPEVEAETVRYLKSRWNGSEDWIWFHDKPQIDLKGIEGETGVDFSKPCVGMLTNVMWDAQLHYPANAFPNMLDWAVKTIAYFAKRPDLQLLIRVHPAELRGKHTSRQPIADEIRKAFPILPRNVFIIGPESQVSTYAAMLECDAVIIYGTKTGVELTSFGIPVIVAGEAWIRNKGVTLDATSIPGYFSILDRLPLGKRMDAETVSRARKYAYHFFFRRMIPLGNLLENDTRVLFTLGVKRLDDVLPGASAGLDAICEGILESKPFLFQPDPVSAEKQSLPA